MKRLHVHVSVADLGASIRFYSRNCLPPSPACRRRMLDDPRVNFAISQRDGRPRVQYLGIQVENRTVLLEVFQRLQRAEGW